MLEYLPSSQNWQMNVKTLSSYEPNGLLPKEWAYGTTLKHSRPTWSDGNLFMDSRTMNTVCVLRFAHTLGKGHLNHAFKQVAISCLVYENYIDGGWIPRGDKANCLLKKKKKNSSHKLSFKCRPSFSLLKRKLLL